ncbi:MCE family protein [Candidatus Poribacteria bacterium]|nr:MCE family protein [Candidatus Poribacteria bacterium]
MENKWWRDEFKVGLMTIVGVILLSVLLMKSSQWRLSSGEEKARIHFNYVGGLLKNAPVHIHGLEVGNVTSVKLTKENKVEVVVTFREEVEIREGYQIRIDIVGIVGEKYVEISNGPPGNPVTTDDPLIGIDPISVGDVLTKADEITDKTINTIDFIQEFINVNKRDIDVGATQLKNFIIEVKNMLQKTMGNVDSLITRLDRITRNAESDVGETVSGVNNLVSNLQTDREELKALVQDVSDDLDQIMAKTVPDLESSMENFQEISEGMKTSTSKAARSIDDLSEFLSEFTEKLDKMANYSDEKLQKGLEDFDKSAESISRIARNMDTIFADIKEGKGTVGKLITDDEGYNQLTEALSEGKKAIANINRASDRVNKGVRVFDLMSPIKEYELSYDSLARSLQNQFTVTITGSSPYEYIAGVSVRHKMFYDLQVGRRFGNFMGRVGAIRSKSSIGLDYWAFSDRLWTSLEFIDVTDRQPTLDLDLAFKFYENWYFIFGARDLAGSDIGFNIGVRGISED